MLRTVHLYGEMAERFGPSFRLDVASLKDVAQALGAQLNGFRDYIIAGTFKVVAGPSLDDGFQLDETQIEFRVGARDFHVVPVTAGAKRGGLGKLIAGVLIAVFAWYVAPGLIGAGMGTLTIAGLSPTTIAMFGVSLALAGASQLLAPKTKKQNPAASGGPERRPSFVFNGAVNSSEQGGCLPLIYGKTMVGSIVVSAGMTTDDIPD